MDKIERSAYYYRLKAEKFEKTGKSHNQARVHRELEQLVLTCSSLEEIQAKMGEQGYFDKPGQALMKDKMLSLRDAARENGFEKVAGFYQEQHDKISHDPNLMYSDTEYATKVTKELGRIGIICGEVTSMFHAYIAIQDHNVNPCAEDEFKKQKDYILSSITNIQQQGEMIADAISNPYNREHIGIPDEGYEKFKQFVLNIVSENFDESYKADFNEEFKRVWEILKPKKKELGEIVKKDWALCIRSTYLSIPPKEAGGEYELIMNEKTPS